MIENLNHNFSEYLDLDYVKELVKILSEPKAENNNFDDDFNKILDILFNKKNTENYFYINISNFSNMTDDNDIHLELLDKDILLKNIDRFYFPLYKLSTSYSLIITNNNEILRKYKFAINFDEFIAFCRFKDYNINNITINLKHISGLSRDVFYYVAQLLIGNIFSANMNYINDELSDECFYTNSVYCNGWLINREFQYIEPPERYPKEKNYDGKFYFEDIKVGNIAKFNKIINFDIVESFKSNNFKAWENRKGMLRYFDKVSRKRFYISVENLLILLKDPELDFEVETKLDRYFYIEYYVTKIINKKFKRWDEGLPF